jgi:hypothetical protein
MIGSPARDGRATGILPFIMTGESYPIQGTENGRNASKMTESAAEKAIALQSPAELFHFPTGKLKKWFRAARHSQSAWSSALNAQPGR